MLWGAQAAAAVPGEDCGAPAYWRTVSGLGFRPAENLRGRAGWVSDGIVGYPITVHGGDPGGSYPVSLRTLYVRYPRNELDMLPGGGSRIAARLGLTVLDAILTGAGSEQTVQWNSWMLSTNPVPPGLPDSIPEVTRTLAREFPDHAIVLRNVDERCSPGLPARLRAAGYRLLAARIVHCFDARHGALKDTSTLRRDRKELGDADGPEWVAPWDLLPADAGRISELYRRLYLEKHSWLNPRYDESFVRAALRDHWLEFHGLRDRRGRLVGVFGLFSLDGLTTTVPFVGHDTSLPAGSGIYRRLFLRIHREVSQRRQLLNYSSGAGDFKRRRGSLPTVEFNAVYDRHLPPRRRMAFRFAELALNRLVQPWLERARL